MPRTAGLPAGDLGANARATGEVLAAEQPSNNDKGDVENTTQVLAELKKQQREPPLQGATDGLTRAIHGASQDAEIPATNPAPRSQLRRLPRRRRFGVLRLLGAPPPPPPLGGDSLVFSGLAVAPSKLKKQQREVPLPPMHTVQNVL
jgi:hypothetical protein